MDNNYKKVVIYTDGIYDLFHRGHVESFKYCKSMYPNVHLIVGVFSDKNATGYKRPPVYCEEDRYELVSTNKWVDEVILDCPFIVSKELMEQYNIDLVVHGFSNPSDSSKQEDFFKYPKEINKFMEIPYYSKISTTDIIKKINL